MSKTVLPSTDDKYQSPRYKKGVQKPKGPCTTKKCPKDKNIRKMSSCPLFEETPKFEYLLRESISTQIERDYFENMGKVELTRAIREIFLIRSLPPASIIPEKDSDEEEELE